MKVIYTKDQECVARLLRLGGHKLSEHNDAAGGKMYVIDVSQVGADVIYDAVNGDSYRFFSIEHPTLVF